MRKTILISTAAIIGTMLLSNCKKSGCTDTDAANYDAKAKTKCCCEYDAKALFYWTSGALANLQSTNDTLLRVEIGGSTFGPKKASLSSDTDPGCGNTAFLVTTRRISSKSQQFTYKVKSQRDTVLWSGVVTMKGAECVQVKLN